MEKITVRFNDDSPRASICRVPALIPTWAHTAYLVGHITRQEWLLLCGLHSAWVAAWYAGHRTT